jgi:predicted RNase H-like HicB family nuclease
MTIYLATVHKDEHSDYGVQFYDFPGCISAGDTIEMAQRLAQEALAGQMALMQKDGEEIPEPSSLERILSDPLHQDAVAFIPVTVSETRSVLPQFCLQPS